MGETNVNTISGSVKLIENCEKTTLFLLRGTKIVINNVLISPKFWNILLNFRDIRQNWYHIATVNKTNGKFLLITNTIFEKKRVLEKLPSLSSDLYYAQISAVEIHYLIDQKSTHFNDFMIWHDRFKHPRFIMMSTNNWEFTRSLIEKLKDNKVKWIFMYCLLSRKINC